MAKRARTSKKTTATKRSKPAKRTTKTVEAPVVEQPMTFTEPTSVMQPQAPMPKWVLILLGLVAIAVVLLAVRKDLWLVAVVEGKPIFKWQLTQMLMQRYGTQTADSMISEALIAHTAATSGITVTQAEIDEKEKEIVASFGGKVSVEELLKFQGMSKAEFDNQVRTQLVVTKIVGKDIKVTDADVTAFLEKNRETMTATDEAALKKEATDAVMNQKISEKVQPWFTELRSKAKITKFIQ